MILKLLFKGDKSYLATEKGEIIENISIMGTDISIEWVETPSDIHPTKKDVVFGKQQFLMQIQFEGQVGVIPTDVDGSIVEVPQIEQST